MRTWPSATGGGVRTTSRRPAARKSSMRSCAGSTRVAVLEQVELEGPHLRVSAVGFGCGGLMQSPSRRERMAVLGAAVDNGITPFDTARMYGLGMAETELGAFLRNV